MTEILTKYCPNCDKFIDLTPQINDFCPRCRTELINKPIEQKKENISKKIYRVRAQIIQVIGFFLIVFSLLLLFIPILILNLTVLTISSFLFGFILAPIVFNIFWFAIAMPTGAIIAIVYSIIKGNWDEIRKIQSLKEFLEVFIIGDIVLSSIITISSIFIGISTYQTIPLIRDSTNLLSPFSLLLSGIGLLLGFLLLYVTKKFRIVKVEKNQ